LQPYPDQVRQRYERRLADQQASGRRFTLQQWWWLDRIADYTGLNLSIDAVDLTAGNFLAHGGLFGVRRDLGQEWQVLVAELNEVLVV
jgi:type I restriction enzyme R subunit